MRSSPFVHRSPSRRRPLGAAALVAALTASSAALADDYEAASERADEAATRGDWAAAASALAPLLSTYPQDYDVALRLGGIELRRGRPADAARAYRSAIARSPLAAGGHRGLAVALDAEGRCEEAARALGTANALSLLPEAEASALLRCSAPPPFAAAAPPPIALAPITRTTIGVAAQAFAFPSHPTKQWAKGLALSADVARGAYEVGATGRVEWITPQAVAGLSSFRQEEGYVRAGVGNERLGVSVLGAIVHDGSGVMGTSKHVGAVGRLSGTTHLFLSGAASFYPDGTVLRLSPEWRVPLDERTALTPAFAVQRALGETLFSGSLTLSHTWQRGTLYAGGKIGTEVRPAYLAASVVYDVPERILWGGWAGVLVKATSNVSIKAAYSLDRTEGTYFGVTRQSNLHSLTVGPIVEF